MAIAPYHPLEPAWEPLLADALARRVDPRALARMVARLSVRYRGDDVELAPGDALAARALFWFPRDVHKVSLPVAELVAGAALPSRPLRVLDLGAGLGATSLGVARALRGHGTLAEVHALDRDPQALTLLKRIADRASSQALVAPIASLHTDARDLSVAGWDVGLGRYDLVTAGLAFVELTRHLGAESTRAEALASHLETALAHVADDGALVVIEPATRDDARALQLARSLLLARGVTVYAPCLHADACPMLASPRDWCHDDLAEVELPPWLHGVAREAGLRWEGVTFAYLVLRRDGRTLRDALAPGRRALRLLSPPIVTKGKTEAVVCAGAAQQRVMELAREAKRAEGDTLGGCARGDVVVLGDDVVLGEGGSTRLTPGAWRRVGATT